MIINHNIAALNTHRQLGANQGAVQNSLEKLSSGLQINKAGDDAAGLAISEKMRGQIRGLEMATKNAQDGISLIQTAEGALNETHSILQRMRELAVQSSNDTNTDSDRAELQKEMNQLIEEIDRISENTEFNTQNLLDGNFSGKFHIGANADQNLQVDIDNMGTAFMGTAEVAGYSADEVINANDLDYSESSEEVSLTVGGETVATITLDEEFESADALLNAVNGQLSGSGISAELDDGDINLLSINEFSVDGNGASSTLVSTGVEISSLSVDTETENSGGILTQSDADSAITAINNAIETVSAQRSNLGAFQNRLEHTINNLGASTENLTAAESRIRDVDMASEMMEFTKNNILSQAAQSMLAQANQQPQGVLQLLQ